MFIKGTQNKLPISVSPIHTSNKNPTKDKNEQLHNLILDFEKKTYKKLLSLHEIKYKSLVLFTFATKGKKPYKFPRN